MKIILITFPEDIIDEDLCVNLSGDFFEAIHIHLSYKRFIFVMSEILWENLMIEFFEIMDDDLFAIL